MPSDIIDKERTDRTEIEADAGQMGIVQGNLHCEITLRGPDIGERTVLRPRKLPGDRNVRRPAEARHRVQEASQARGIGIEGREEIATVLGLVLR